MVGPWVLRFADAARSELDHAFVAAAELSGNIRSDFVVLINVDPALGALPQIVDRVPLSSLATSAPLQTSPVSVCWLLDLRFLKVELCLALSSPSRPPAAPSPPVVQAPSALTWNEVRRVAASSASGVVGPSIRGPPRSSVSSASYCAGLASACNDRLGRKLRLTSFRRCNQVRGLAAAPPTSP